MIHSFYVKNFYCFYDENGINLDNKRNSSDIRFVNTNNITTSKTCVLFGANASGKTNFLKGITFLSWFMRSSWKCSIKTLIPIDRFLFTANNDIIEFKLCSENNGNIYHYELKIKEGDVLYERLMIRNKDTNHNKNIFVKDDMNLKIYDDCDFSSSDISFNRKNNFSIISYALCSGSHFFDDFLMSFWCVSNIAPSKTTWINPMPIDRLYKDNVFLNKVVVTLKRFDTGIDNIIVKKEETGNKLLMEHIISDKKYFISFDDESYGVQQLIKVLTLIYDVLERGNILVYDELDNSLHTNLLPEILNLFYTEETNPHNAQIICSCNSADLLNFLCKENIFIIEKDKNQCSSVYCLSDIKGVHNGDDFRKKYLSGVYGGVPVFV